MKRYIRTSTDNRYEWSWEAKERQLTESSKVGDVVNVGYISDKNKHNYEDATIVEIRSTDYYPNGDYSKKTKRLDAVVEFANGDTMRW